MSFNDLYINFYVIESKNKYLSFSGALKYYNFKKLIELFDNEFILVNKSLIFNFALSIVS